MTFLIPVLLVMIGAYFLYKGAALLIESASSLAQNLGIPLVMIGFTIVALGTSLPELIVGVIAGFRGNTDIVVGNILGSNAANLGLVLGLAALLLPKALPPDRPRFEMMSLIVSAVTLSILAADGMISRLDGALMILLGVTFSVMLVRRHQKSKQLQQIVERVVTVQHRRDRVLNILALAAAVGLMFVGARMLVENAVQLAGMLGVNEVIVGLTVVAIGTSLPEIFTTVVSARRKRSELIVSNVLGSNTLNILVVLGTTALILPTPVSPPFLRFDLPVLIGMCILTYILLRKGRTLAARDGILLISIYFAYVAFTFVVRTGSGFLLAPFG